jgi:hypothetical protein
MCTFSWVYVVRLKKDEKKSLSNTLSFISGFCVPLFLSTPCHEDNSLVCQKKNIVLSGARSTAKSLREICIMPSYLESRSSLFLSFFLPSLKPINPSLGQTNLVVNENGWNRGFILCHACAYVNVL